MKKTVLLLSSALLIFPQTVKADITVSGRVKLFTSLFLKQNDTGPYFIHDSGEFAIKRIETRLRLSGFLSDKISYGVRFDSFSQPDALFTAKSLPESSSLGAPTLAEPFDFFLYEGNIKISDFLFRGLDLTLGKQRIQWGTADMVNVIDNLNPVDFANFLTFDPDYFGERRPQTALNFEYYLSGFTKIQLIWLLSRQISPLPADFSDLATGGLTSSSIRIDTENKLLRNTNFALRFATVLLNTDIGLSYYKGNFNLPLLCGVTPVGLTELEYSYAYPQKQVLGMDIAGEILSAGFWAELAYTIPEDMEAFAFNERFPLFEGPYFKYILGLDYTADIGTGIYLNAQYLHGFFDEADYSGTAESLFGFKKGMFFGEIQDFILASAEYSMLRENLKIKLGGIVEFGDHESAFSFMPSLEYKIKDTVSFQAGGFIVSGSETNTKFGPFKNDNILFFAFKTDF